MSLRLQPLHQVRFEKLGVGVEEVANDFSMLGTDTQYRLTPCSASGPEPILKGHLSDPRPDKVALTKMARPIVEGHRVG
jgi:hypothetical protein